MIQRVRNEALSCDLFPLPGLECSPGHQGRQMCRGTHTHVPADGQHMKTIHMSKSVMSAPFLQVTAWSWNRCSIFILSCSMSIKWFEWDHYDICHVQQDHCHHIPSLFVSAPCPHIWAETLPLQHSQCVQYRAAETPDEAALSQCAALVCPVRWGSKRPTRLLWPLPSASCCVLSLSQVRVPPAGGGISMETAARCHRMQGRMWRQGRSHKGRGKEAAAAAAARPILMSYFPK